MLSFKEIVDAALLTMSDHNSSQSTWVSVNIKKTNVKASLNYMSTIFHNINLNMLYLYVNFQYLCE